MKTGLMTTTARLGPIRGHLGPRTVFVNDVISVKQDGVVGSLNRCEWVDRRRSVPLSRPLRRYFRHRIISLVTQFCLLGAAERLAGGSRGLSRATLRWQPERRIIDSRDGRRRVRLHGGQHGHDFSGIGRRIHSGRHRRWVGEHVLCAVCSLSRCRPASFPCHGSASCWAEGAALCDCCTRHKVYVSSWSQACRSQHFSDLQCLKLEL